MYTFHFGIETKRSLFQELEIHLGQERAEAIVRDPHPLVFPLVDHNTQEVFGFYLC